jgi:hypothetical protein
MNPLTKSLGRFPAGIWVVLALLILGLIFGVAGQAISVISWDLARSLGLQEDNPQSEDPMEQSLVPIEWGTAVTDLVLQTTFILLALYGIFRRHWIGLAAATAQFTVYAYVGLQYYSQRYGIKVWGTGDWAHWQGLATFVLVSFALVGLIGLICLWSNRKYFEFGLHKGD